MGMRCAIYGKLFGADGRPEATQTGLVGATVGARVK